VAQVIVAVPTSDLAKTFGCTRFQAVNATLTILGFFSLSVAASGLIPLARQTSQTETRMAILEIGRPALFPWFDTARRHRL
jgi:hypothetical protein